MAKRIQNFINFNSEKEESTPVIKKSDSITKSKKMIKEDSKNRGGIKTAPRERAAKNYNSRII